MLCHKHILMIIVLYLTDLNLWIQAVMMDVNDALCQVMPKVKQVV